MLLSADHGLSRFRKSNKAFQLHTCITPHSLTPDSLKKEAVILSSSRLYQDRVINERHNIISPEMEDVATAKYLNEKDIFDLGYDTSSKTVESQVLDCLFILIIHLITPAGNILPDIVFRGKPVLCAMIGKLVSESNSLVYFCVSNKRSNTIKLFRSVHHKFHIMSLHGTIILFQVY